MIDHKTSSYTVWSQFNDGQSLYLEGSRTKLKDAFALARRRWREYKGTKVIEVRTIGHLLIADDPSDFTMKTGVRR